MATYGGEEQSIVKEREKLRKAIREEPNSKQKVKLVEEDEQMRDHLASLYAAQDPVHAQKRAEAQQRMAHFQRHGTTDLNKIPRR